MREYKITRCDLGYNIYKITDNRLPRFLSPDKKWVLNRSHAKVYFHRETALSDLIIMKTRDVKMEESD